MADISKIHVAGADYAIKDATARTHIASTNNPHSVTKDQIGLGNVENKSASTILDGLTSSIITSKLGFTPADSSKIGAANGIASLDSGGRVPASQLPSFVDDVVEGYLFNGKFFEDTTYSEEIPGEASKIYVDLTADANKTYRWSGTAFVEISSSLALGETSSTAYRGDRGKTAYDHASDSSRLTTAKSSGFYKIATTAQGHVASVTAVTKADITGLGIPSTNSTYGAGTGLSLNGSTFNHADSIDAQTVEPSEDSSDETIVHFPSLTLNATGHVSGVSTKGVKLDVATQTASGNNRLNITPAGTVSKPTFTGTAATITSADYTPAGTIGVGGTTGTSYTPAGSVTVTPSSASTLASVASAGTVPSWSASVANETLSFSFSAGAMPTFNSANRLTGISSASFSGTATKIAFTGTKANLTASYTPAGSVSQPTFSGTALYLEPRLITDYE